MVKWTIGTIIALMVFSLSAATYLRDTYVPKDSFRIICERLEHIEVKIDKLLTKEK